MDTRKNIKSLVNNEHKKYIQGIEQSVGNNINSFWNYVDKNSREGLVDLFKFNDQTIQGVAQVVESFAEYFASVHSREKSSYNLNFVDIINNNSVLHIGSISDSDYDAAVKKLKPKKAAGWTVYHLTL